MIADKQKEKAKQHLLLALATMLQSMRYAVEYQRIPHGAVGVIATQPDHLRAYGVATNTMHKLRRHAIQTLHSIVVARRH